MGLIGRQQTSGAFQKLDDISSTFDGSKVMFGLTSSGDAFYADNPFTLLVSVNGVVLEPNTAYSIMSMNVIYYRFTHMAKGFDYSAMPANLRMHGMMNTGVEKLVFEMWCLSVSIIYGCEKCINAHENELKSEGASSIQIQA